MQYPKSLQPLPKHAKKVFSGVIFDIWQWEQVMFDGSVQTFEKASRSASVGLLPVTTDKKIVLTIQEQPGMQRFLSLLGGVVDPGEEIVATAKRELKEEAGLVSDDLELWYSVQPVTKVEWPIYLFVARNCEQIAQQSLDAGEKIQVQLVDWDEFLDIICLDEFRDKEVALRLLTLQKDAQKFAEVEKFLFQ